MDVHHQPFPQKTDSIEKKATFFKISRIQLPANDTKVCGGVYDSHILDHFNLQLRKSSWSSPPNLAGCHLGVWSLKGMNLYCRYVGITVNRKPIIFRYQDSMESKKFFMRGSHGIFNTIRIHTRRKEGITSIESGMGLEPSFLSLVFQIPGE